MEHTKTTIEIHSRDYWFKVIDFLQQNWALIDAQVDDGCVVYFFGDTSGVFDRMYFGSAAEAERELSKNGFKKYDLDEEATRFIRKPVPPFEEHQHPNGAIYSSGRYWRQ